MEKMITPKWKESNMPLGLRSTRPVPATLDNAIISFVSDTQRVVFRMRRHILSVVHLVTLSVSQIHITFP